MRAPVSEGVGGLFFDTGVSRKSGGAFQAAARGVRTPGSVEVSRDDGPSGFLRSSRPIWMLRQSPSVSSGPGNSFFAKKFSAPRTSGFIIFWLRSGRAGFILIDFEYFGWDDPAKTMSDFILQPERPLPPRLIPFFVGKFSKMFDNRRGLLARFELVCPTLWLKWSLIMLNPYLPGRNPRHARSVGQMRRLQLEKAARNTERLSAALDAGIFGRWTGDADREDDFR